jgi:predicted nucleic acid-binding protein
VYYLDTSAAVKLVLAEKSSTALRRWLSPRDDQVASSDLLRTELLRATRRAAPAQMAQARAVLDALFLVTMSTAVFERAARLDPDMLRSLDSLHLATALEFGDELEGILTYDRRLADACRALGIVVIAPS